MKTRLRIAALALLCIASPAFAGGWPTPTIPVISVPELPQPCNIANTGSMRPLIDRGDFVLLVPYMGQPLQRGMVLSFNRDAKTPRCLHMVADVRGEYVYMSGINTRRSDGWFHRSKINAVAVMVFTTRTSATR